MLACYKRYAMTRHAFLQHTCAQARLQVLGGMLPKSSQAPLWNHPGPFQGRSSNRPGQLLDNFMGSGHFERYHGSEGLQPQHPCSRGFSVLMWIAGLLLAFFENASHKGLHTSGAFCKLASHSCWHGTTVYSQQCMQILPPFPNQSRFKCH